MKTEELERSQDRKKKEVQLGMPTAAKTGNPRIHKFVSWLTISLAIIVIIMLLWELVVIAFNMPIAVLPSPVRVWDTMVGNFTYLRQNSVPTILESVVGYLAAVVLSIPLGYLLSRPGRLSTALNTAVLSAQIFPKIAVAPLFVVWFGFGYFPKFLFVFILGFFPITLSSAAGFSSAPTEVRDLGKVLGLSKWEQIRKLLWPGALPQIFTGMKISAAFAITAAIVYEFVGANHGLGYIIDASQANIDTPMAFAAVIFVTVLGFLFYGVVALIETLAIPWHVSHRSQT
jgi:NitT/TauT family transport system permease protein